MIRLRSETARDRALYRLVGWSFACGFFTGTASFAGGLCVAAWAGWIR